MELGLYRWLWNPPSWCVLLTICCGQYCDPNPIPSEAERAGRKPQTAQEEPSESSKSQSDMVGRAPSTVSISYLIIGP